MELLKEYTEFVKQFRMVGSNVLFLRKDGYTEIVSVGNAHLEKQLPLQKDERRHPARQFPHRHAEKAVSRAGL